MASLQELVNYLNQRYNKGLTMGPTGGDATNGTDTLVDMGRFIMHQESGRRSGKNNARGVMADDLGLSS